MCVAHVVGHFGLPSETFVPNAIEDLEALGWEAWVLTLSVANRCSFPFPPDERIVCVPPGGAGLRLIRRVLRSGPRRFAAAGAPRLAAVEPALVHAHFGWSGLLALPLARRLDVPLLVTFHATDVTVFPRLARRWRLLTAREHKYVELFRRLERAIVVSHFIEGELRALGFEGRIDIVPPGVRLGDFRFRSKPPARRPTRLLYVGRLVHRKGLDVLLRALPQVAAEDDRVQLDVIGDGSSRQEYERTAARLGLAERVTFHGARPPVDVREALRRAHLLVVPSRTLPNGEAEGSPVVTKEALAIGVPIVATRSGGLPETLPSIYRDELVAEEDPAALGERIAQLLRDDADWPERARAGRRWVEREFDASMLARRTSDIYRDSVRSYRSASLH